jgi:DNA-binding XRE family transcriptional regulator
MESLRALRHNKGLTAKEAAAQIGVGVPTLLNAESGAAAPIVQNKHKIASFYGVQVVDIWPVPETERAA